MKRARRPRLVPSFALLLAALCAGDAAAQITGGPQHRPGRRSMVRSADTLYAVGLVDTGEVTLWRAPEGSASWTAVVIAGGINDASSGIGANVPTNMAAITATRDGVLHITWARGSYPSFYEQYYRAVDPRTLAPVTGILNVTTVANASTTRRTDSVDIAAVDDAGSGEPAVYLTAQGSSNWRNNLLRIDRQAGAWAATPAPVDLGVISTTASSQRTRLAVAPDGTVHVGFYNNAGNGDYVHRSWDGAAWGAQSILGDGVARRDLSGDISVDPAGVVHAVYNHWLTTTQSELRYRALVGGTWSAETLVHTPAANVDLDNRLAMTTDVFGDVFALYYNGADELALRRGSAAGFSAEQVLLPSGLATPWFPVARGSLFPASDRNHCEVDLLLRWSVTPPEQVFHLRQSSCGCGTLGLSFSGSWGPGTNGAVDLSGGTPNDFAVAVLGVDLLDVPVPALGCPCPLFVRPDLPVLALVDGAGAAQVQVPIPTTPVGTTIWAQWLTLGPTLTGCQSSVYGARYVP